MYACVDAVGRAGGPVSAASASCCAAGIRDDRLCLAGSGDATVCRPPPHIRFPDSTGMSESLLGHCSNIRAHMLHRNGVRKKVVSRRRAPHWSLRLLRLASRAHTLSPPPHRCHCRRWSGRSAPPPAAQATMSARVGHFAELKLKSAVHADNTCGDTLAS